MITGSTTAREGGEQKDMAAEKVLVTNDGYTDTAYPSCGDRRCTEVILECIGVPSGTLAELDMQDVRDLSLGEDVTVTVALLGESDSCEWCATCGTFLRHGLYYEGEDAGCQHGPSGEDRPDLPGPHVHLMDRPAMRDYWGWA